MSYNQTHTKQFVKAKPLHEPKEKPPSTSFTKDQKKNNKKYEEKSFQQNKDPRDHIKILLNQFKLQEKTPNVSAICQKFPKLFVDKPLKPQPENQSTLTQFVLYGTKKQIPNKPVKQMSSDSSDPDWDSDEQKQVKLVSKKIDNAVIEKVSAIKKQVTKKINDLQRHEKQFLEEYYRQKRHQEFQNPIIKEQQKQQTKPMNNKVETTKDNDKANNSKVEQKDEDQWAECDPNVGALITGGFLQKVQKGEEEDFQIDDFSYESEKSQKSSSSDDDDDMFADEGPRAVTKTKEDTKKNETKKESGKQIVSITSHLFTQIAEQVGALPESCTWIISDKQVRYKVSTQYMNEIYKSISSSLPYISLNHSDYIHCDELQTQKGVEKLKKSSQKRRSANANGFTKNRNAAAARPQVPHYKQKK